MDIQPGDLVTTLKDLGVEVASHASSVDDTTADLVRELLASKPQEESEKVIEVPETVILRDFAEQLGVEPSEIQKHLIEIGVLVALNQSITLEQAQKIGSKLGYSVKKGQGKPAAKPKHKPKPGAKGAWERPAVVTVLGHVDHGKTSLLDAIRHTQVTEGEFGGITQHIGAYQVVCNDKLITFIDTPGHEAFTSMRARGAQVTDIAVLVVAADDGVMPQTREAIDHAKAAEVPIVVALNKIDRPEANPDRVKQQLLELGLVSEEWGGDTMIVPVSATTKEGLDNLLESIQLQAEMLELTADPAAEATGVVVESRLERGKGPTATVLVQNGTLRVGQSVVVGSTYGKIKAMMDDKGERVTKAGPSTPIEVVGLVTVPSAGDTLTVAADERAARQLSSERAEKERDDRLGSSARISLEDLYRTLREGETKELKIVLRADVDGSAEAIKQSLNDLKTDEVEVRVIQSAVGSVGEGDVLLASASDAVIIAFNVKIEREAIAAAEKERVEIRQYNIIYELLDHVRKAMSGLLEPELREEIQGHAEVRALFRIPGGVVAGSYVLDGKVTRTSQARLSRDNELIYTGRVETLRRFKEDAREVASGFECGIQLAGFTDVQEGDVIEFYVVQEFARVL